MRQKIQALEEHLRINKIGVWEWSDEEEEINEEREND